MGFRGEAFAFDSPEAAVAGFIARAVPDAPARPVERVDAVLSIGRVLAEDVMADRDSPAFDHSAMDGYAVRAADLARAPADQAGRITIDVTAESRIGKAPPAFQPPDRSFLGATAVRISTGAAVPVGADAIIRREDVVESASCNDIGSGRALATGVASITLPADVAARIRSGVHIRRRGENARSGTAVLTRGEWVTAAGVGTLASVGHVRPAVFSRVRVTLITTGDELVAPESAPERFQLRNSNAVAIHAALASHAWIEVVSVNHIPDGADLAGLITRAAAASDAIVLTGGVSMGHRDPVRAAIDALAAEVVFHGLPQRPGKPMLGAILRAVPTTNVWTHPIQGVALFGLPGNPISALVTFTRIVLPVLAALSGASRPPPNLKPRMVELVNHDGRTLDLWWHRLVRLAGPGGESVSGSCMPCVGLVDHQGSGDICAGGRSDGFVEIAPGPVDSARPQVLFYPFPM